MNFGKAAKLFLAVTAPVLAVAQATQSSAPQKPSPGTRAAHATILQGLPQSPLSVQESANSNFYRPRGTATTNPTTTQPLASQPVTVRNTIPAQLNSLTSSAPQPTVTAPVPSNSQPSAPQADGTKSPSPEGSAAVDYHHGQLTVVSERAPLGVVLKLIAAKTGAFVDLSPELQNEPVIAMLGPGPVREVMAELLDSPRVDYIIMGTGDTPGSLERIVVRTRQSFARTAMAAVRRPQPSAGEGSNLNGGAQTANGLPLAEAKLTQEQLMENWKKIREEKRLAEIEQQRRDRENEKTQPQIEPQPEPAVAENQPDNPPQK
ncbi:MAG TPA: hypothetical protein VGH51_14425 [Candidatus Angelobacter sp.]|jgi:hypothetical protein